MSFSGGVYTLPGPALVTGEIVSATENNQFRNDVAGAFNVTMLRNGTSTATANLPMGGYKLTGLGAATTSGDALSYGNAAVVTTLTSTSLTATRVPYAGTGGLLQDASTFTFDGTTLTAGGFSTSGNISAATASISGNVTYSGGTANGVAYLNGSKVLTTGSALTWNGSFLSVNGGIGAVNGNQIYSYNSDNTNYVNVSNVGATGSTNGQLAWTIGNVGEQMRLTSTGLGIGTSSPGAKLEVIGSGRFGNAATAGQVTINAVTGAGTQFNWATNGTVLFALGTNVGSGSPSNWSLYDYANGLTAFTVQQGNLGLGVTPSAWDSAYKALQVSYGSLAANTGSVQLSHNWYYNAGNKYIASDYASNYYQYQGKHIWQTAPSGTAGNAISFTQAMTLDASGRLGVGVTSPQTPLHVVGASYQLRLGESATTGGVLDLGATSTSCQIVANYYATAVPLTFTTGGSERMRIDSSGNVGIGTSSPNQKLEVTGTIRVSRAGTPSTFMEFFGGDGSIDPRINVPSGFGIPFNVGGSEKARIDSSGNLLVGTTGASPFDSCRIAVDASNEGMRMRNTSSSGASSATMIRFLSAANATVGSINATGTATSYATSSDYRLKENIQPMQNALATVAQLNPVTYTWKVDGSDGQGFIAHELQAVVPDCVTGVKDAVDEEGKPVYQGIDTSFLVATLTKAIQEQQEQINQLKAEVAALKGN